MLLDVRAKYTLGGLAFVLFTKMLPLINVEPKYLFEVISLERLIQ